jgi:hypothetical protein
MPISTRRAASGTERMALNFLMTAAASPLGMVTTTRKHLR